MTDFVQLWVYLSSTPLFGLTATLVVYVLAHAFYVRMGQAPWANPVLWSVVVLAAALLASGIAYPTYFSGAQFIHFLLGPAVVALAWPLWQRRVALRAHWTRFALASVTGGAAAAASAVGLAWAMGLPLQCDEPADFMSFRVGLFGLEKWHNVDRTVGQLAAALDRLGIGAKAAAPELATAK